MALAASDLVWYASANMPEDDVSPSGGAIDTATRVIPDSASLFNAPGDTLEMLSSDAGDTMNVTITGRKADGTIVSETKALSGTTVVAFTTNWDQLLKIVLSAAAVGTVTIRTATADTLIVDIEPGVTAIRRPFYDAGANETGGSAKTLYEKLFLKNTNGASAALSLEISENADPEAQFEFAIEDAIDDNEQTADRTTAPVGITVDGFSSLAKTIPGNDLAAGSAIGVWLKLDLPAGDPATKTTLTMRATANSG